MGRLLQSVPDDYIDWLKRHERTIEGLDHLAVQVVSANLYERLLPGITNLTDRARYFSFYSWVLHLFAQEGDITHGPVPWLNWLRCFEFTYALACVAHEQAENTFDARATGTVGALRARRLVRDATGKANIDIHSAAMLNRSGKVAKAGAYFLNREGGYAQYYKGAMESLGILKKDPDHDYPDRMLTTYAGKLLAESLTTVAGFHTLAEIARAGNASVSELARVGKQVGTSCIEPGSHEEDQLRRLMMGDDDDLCRGQDADSRTWRRASLLLLLRFVSDCGSIVFAEIPDRFRWSCTTMALPDGQPWKLPSSLGAATEAWGAYHRNEVANYCLECLLFLVVRHLQEAPTAATGVVRWLVDTACAGTKKTEDNPATPPLAGSVSDWIVVCTRPKQKCQEDPWGGGSTWAWWCNLTQAVADRNDSAVASWAVRLLGRLGTEHRPLSKSPFGHLPQSSELALTHRVHLGTLISRVDESASEKISSFLTRLILDWVVFRHLRVATRKLANEGKSTFKFRVDQGLLVAAENDPPAPTLTNPRLRPARNILTDLHYLCVDDGQAQLTDDGTRLLTSSL